MLQAETTWWLSFICNPLEKRLSGKVLGFSRVSGLPFCYCYDGISFAWNFSVKFNFLDKCIPEASVMAASIIDHGRLCTPDWKDRACGINWLSYFILHWSRHGTCLSSFILKKKWTVLLILILTLIWFCSLVPRGKYKESNSWCWIWEHTDICNWKGTIFILPEYQDCHGPFGYIKDKPLRIHVWLSWKFDFVINLWNEDFNFHGISKFK